MCLILSALYQTLNFNINSILDFNVEEYPSPQIPKILLLYSRDCEQFMEMMTTFRELLEGVTGCKVGNYSLLTLNASMLKKKYECKQLAILNNPFYFILFIPFGNSLTQNISIYSQYIVYEVNGIGDWESVNITKGDVQILSKAFLNMFPRSASFIGELLFW
jgi:hypothetical protein